MAAPTAPGPCAGVSPPGAGAVDGVVAELIAMLAGLGRLALDDTVGVEDPVRVDRIAVLERVKAAAGAAQAAEMVRFGVSQVRAQERAVVDPRVLGRGIADQIALACKVSPSQGSRRLGIARTLHVEMPAVAGLYRGGELSDYVVGLIATETRHLDPARRAVVDGQLAAAGIHTRSPRRAAALARRLGYEADPRGFLGRGRTQRTQGRVTIRPAPDTMTNLTAFLPVEQGVACWAALTHHTDTIVGQGDERSRDQIMADTLVERLTGQTTASDVNVEVAILLPLAALLDPDSARTADITGFGPIPARLARDILTSTTGRRWWRRVFTAPTVTDPATTGPTHGASPTPDDPRADDRGPIIGGDPRRRRFDGWLAHLIGLRDGGRCRDPYCDAPLRHHDHIHRHRDGGPTTLTDGRGTCARGNHVREVPGWKTHVTHDGLRGSPHTVTTTTPTGHTYTGEAPRPP